MMHGGSSEAGRFRRSRARAKTSLFNCIGGNFGRVVYGRRAKINKNFAQKEQPMCRRDFHSTFGIAASAVALGRPLS
jgi:hypothetical protein